MRALLVLQSVTAGTVLIKENTCDDDNENYLVDDYSPKVIPFIDEIINQWPEEREAIIDALSKPYLPYPSWKVQNLMTGECTSVSGIKFKFPLLSRPIEGCITVKFEPLILDKANDMAFYPITINIIFGAVPIGDGRFYRPEPHYWPKEAKEAFWKQAIDYVENQLNELQENIEEVRTLSQKVDQKEPDKQRQLKTDISMLVTQKTFMEVCILGRAIADGQRRRWWSSVKGETALQYIPPDKSIQVKLTPANLTLPSQQDITHEVLLDHLKEFELATVLLMHVLIDCVLHTSEATATLDDLIKSIGWEPRSTAERNKMRAKAWQWMRNISAMPIIGKRPGNYRDPRTKKFLELTSVTPVIIIEETCFADDKSIPVEVTWRPGKWLERLKGNKQVLQDYGDISKIAAIPSGKPSGAWAQSIGLTLNQLWRERASRAKVNYEGETNKPIVAFEPFTRFELLDLFRCEPWVEDILNSSNPKRAKDYWNSAIQILCPLKNTEDRIIGYYKEIDPLPAEKERGWQHYWLRKQRLDIRPERYGTDDISKIVRNAEKIKNQMQRSSSKR